MEIPLDAHPRSDALLDQILAEFPAFEIRSKKDSSLQRAIHFALAVLTLGGQRSYLSAYYTAMFGQLWVPESWEGLPDLDRYILLCHERVHLRQRRRLGDVGLAFVYLLPFFPLFLAYGRARIEWEAYTETLRATAEVYGFESAERLREPIVRRFVGGEYGWMWPFPRVIHRWFDETMDTLRPHTP
jgi:hypothetical protein